MAFPLENQAHDLSYDDVGNLQSTTYRNGVATTYSYNPRNWLRCLTSVLGAAVVASFDYDGALAAQAWPAETRLSPTGQRRAVVETVGTATRTVAYGYDLLSRLTKEDIQAATASPTALVAYDGTGTGQGYDRVGNRRSRQVTGTLPGVSAYTGHTFSERDLLNPGTAYAYDPNGNTTQEPGGILYAYDAENRLVKVTKPDGTTVALTYDADGNRVKKVVDPPGTANDTTALYLVDDRNPTGYAQVVEERDDAGATTVTYTYGLDLVSQRRGAKVDYYGYDGLGSVRYLTDEAGAVTDTYTYDAFGIPIASTGNTPNAYRYTGEQWDDNLNLYYLRARYYEPQLGRFWTMDSYEGSQSDPLSLHKYLYAHGNPVNGTDPSGHENLTSINFAGAIQTGLAGLRTGVAVARAFINAHKLISCTFVFGSGAFYGYTRYLAPGMAGFETTDGKWGAIKYFAHSSDLTGLLKDQKDASVKAFTMTGHADVESFQIGTDQIVIVGGDGAYSLNDRDNQDILGVLKRVLAPNATVTLNGCHSADLARKVSTVLTDAKVVGFSSYIMGGSVVGMNDTLCTFGSKTVWMNGKEVKDGQ